MTKTAYPTSFITFYKLIVLAVIIFVIILTKNSDAHKLHSTPTERNTVIVTPLDSGAQMNKNVEILPKEIVDKPTKILFVGDMSFDRYIRQVSQKKGDDFVFSCIDDFLKKYEYVVGNLEGPITPNKSQSVGTKMGSPKNYVFTFPTTTGALLKRHNVSLVNIGNNHSNDFGRAGVISTKKYLEEAGVNYFGGPPGDDAIYRDKKISFISYNQFGGTLKEDVAREITIEKNDGQTVVVYAHWGEEYAHDPTYLREVATLFVQSGADIIIGSHPHVVLPHETIGRTLVYYSLGNFIFDQYFDERVMVGQVVSVEISNEGIYTTEYPVRLEKDGRTCLAAQNLP